MCLCLCVCVLLLLFRYSLGISFLLPFVRSFTSPLFFFSFRLFCSLLFDHSIIILVLFLSLSFSYTPFTWWDTINTYVVQYTHCKYLIIVCAHWLCFSFGNARHTFLFSFITTPQKNTRCFVVVVVVIVVQVIYYFLLSFRSEFVQPFFIGYLWDRLVALTSFCSLNAWIGLIRSRASVDRTK